VIKELVHKFTKGIILVLVWVMILEIIGFIGAFTLRSFIRYTPYDIPFGKMLPHPAFKYSEMQSGFTQFDPNLGWYSQTYRFGRARRELLPKTSKEYRVFMLGGSSVEGDGVNTEAKTIAKRLEYYLNASNQFADKKVVVYNEGISGYYSKQELLLLATKILPFQEPDMVIVLDGVNDFITHSVERMDLDRIYSKVWHFRELQHTQVMEKVASPRGALINAANWMLALFIKKTYLGTFYDYAYRLVSGNTHGISGRLLILNPSLEPSHEVPEDAIGYYLNNISMMKSLCDGKNVEFFWFPQPTLFLKNELTDTETEIAEQYSDDFWNNFKKFYYVMLDKAHKRFSGESFFRDISASLSSFESSAYADVCHYLPEAQDAIAKVIARQVLKNKGSFLK